MKKGMLLFAFVGLFAIGAQAQSCCSKAKAGEQTSIDKETSEAAMAAAEVDQTVQARTSAVTGQVSFVRSVINNDTGHTTFQEVEYCTKSGKFVNLNAEEKKACTKEAKTSCCAKGAGAKASCSGKKGATTEAAAPTTATSDKKGGA